MKLCNILIEKISDKLIGGEYGMSLRNRNNIKIYKEQSYYKLKNKISAFI